MPFAITLHEADSILEVTYPAQPSREDVEDYAKRVRQQINLLRRRVWSCLVDQRELRVIDPAFVELIAGLNSYAEARGMRRAARVVSSAVGHLQSVRVMREAALRTEFQVFTSREEALAWLKVPPTERPSRP